MTTRSRRPGGTTAAGLVLVLALLGGLLAGCSGDEPATRQSPSASPTPTPSAAPAPSARPTDIRIAGVRGKLSRERRHRVVRAVGNVVDRWIDGAYLGAPPRGDISPALADFTRGARAEARRDRALLSNAQLRGVRSVTATRRKVRLDVLAVGGRAVGVTARVNLAIRIDGARPGRDFVSGALYLTPQKGRWNVFGYDLSRGVSR